MNREVNKDLSVTFMLGDVGKLGSSDIIEAEILKVKTFKISVKDADHQRWVYFKGLAKIKVFKSKTAPKVTGTSFQLKVNPAEDYSVFRVEACHSKTEMEKPTQKIGHGTVHFRVISMPTHKEGMLNRYWEFHYVVKLTTRARSLKRVMQGEEIRTAILHSISKKYEGRSIRVLDPTWKPSSSIKHENCIQQVGELSRWVSGNESTELTNTK